MMNANPGKSFILLVILLVMTVALSGATYYLYYGEKQVSTKLRGEVQDLNGKYEQARQDLEGAKKTAAMLQEKIVEADARVASLTNDLTLEKSAREQDVGELARLRSELQKEISGKSELEKKVESASGQVMQMEARLKEMGGQLEEATSKKLALEKKLQSLESKVELGKIVVGGSSPAAESSPSEQSALAVPAQTVSSTTKGKLEGRVLVVNKEYNFAVINLGAKDGIAVGTVFSVYHNNKNLGDVKVEKVHETMAATGFVNVDVKDRIAEGDRVEIKT